MHGMNIKKIAKCVTIFNEHGINSECQNYVYIHNKWRRVGGMHVCKCMRTNAHPFVAATTHQKYRSLK
jgi:hypothetical protein